MANRLPEIVTGIPTPPSSATDRPPPPRWCTQLNSFYDFRRNGASTFKPLILGCFTYAAVMAVVFLTYGLRCHVSFSVESISVSPSYATWHVDFLVKNPSSRCSIYFDGDEAYVKLGPLNAVVLKTSRTRGARGHASFSVDFATSNQSDVVAASPRVFELDMRLRGKKKRFIGVDGIGHFAIKCQNLMVGHEKIKCHSSFKELKQCCFE